MKKINIVKKITVSAGLLAAVMLLVTGVTYASLKTRTKAVDNVFKGACVNIGIVEKNKNKEMILEDSGTGKYGTYNESMENNSNVYERISENMRTAAKEVAVKNITSQDYPTTDTVVRVRFVPVLVYDDNEQNKKDNIAGQTVPLDMRGKVDYILADGVVAETSSQETEAKWIYKDSLSGDINDRYYYYISALEPGEVSEMLLKEVTYNGELPENTHFELRVLAEGIAKAQLPYLV